MKQENKQFSSNQSAPDTYQAHAGSSEHPSAQRNDNLITREGRSNSQEVNEGPDPSVKLDSFVGQTQRLMNVPDVLGQGANILQQLNSSVLSRNQGHTDITLESESIDDIEGSNSQILREQVASMTERFRNADFDPNREEEKSRNYGQQNTGTQSVVNRNKIPKRVQTKTLAKLSEEIMSAPNKPNSSNLKSYTGRDHMTIIEDQTRAGSELNHAQRPQRNNQQYQIMRTAQQPPIHFHFNLNSNQLYNDGYAQMSQQQPHHQSTQSLSDGTPLIVPNQSQTDLNAPVALQNVQTQHGPHVIVSFPQAFFARSYQQTQNGEAAPDHLASHLIDNDVYQDQNDDRLSDLAVPLQTQQEVSDEETSLNIPDSGSKQEFQSQRQPPFNPFQPNRQVQRNCSEENSDGYVSPMPQTAWNMINSRNGNSVYIRPNTPIRNTLQSQSDSEIARTEQQNKSSIVERYSQLHNKLQSQAYGQNEQLNQSRNVTQPALLGVGSELATSLEGQHRGMQIASGDFRQQQIDSNQDTRLNNTVDSSSDNLEKINLNNILSQNKNQNPLPHLYQRHLRNAKAYLPPLPTTQQISTQQRIQDGKQDDSMLQSSEEATLRENMSAHSSEQLVQRKIRDQLGQARINMVPPPTDVQSPPSLIRTPCINIVPQNSNQPITVVRSRDPERQNQSNFDPSDRQERDSPSVASVDRMLVLEQHQYSAQPQRQHNDLQQNNIAPSVSSPNLTDNNGQHRENHSDQNQFSESQNFTSSTLQTNHDNLTANTSQLNFNVSHSDMRSHQILHRGEQQLVFLQRPPPPSPLKVEDIQSEESNRRIFHYHRTGSMDSGNSLDQAQRFIGNRGQQQPLTQIQSRNAGIPTPMVIQQFNIQESQLEIATDCEEQDLAPSSNDGKYTINGTVYHWTKLDKELQKEERMRELERQVAQLQKENQQLHQILHQHANECPLILKQQEQGIARGIDNLSSSLNPNAEKPQAYQNPLDKGH